MREGSRSIRTEECARVTSFRRQFPDGRLETHIVRWTRRHVVVQARVFRELNDPHAAATAFGVWYREIGSEAQRHSVVDGMLEAVETLAVERALALLDVGAAAVEVRTPAARPAPPVRLASATAVRHPAATQPMTSAPTLSPDVADLLALLERAARHLVRPARAARWRAQLIDDRSRPPASRLKVFEGRLRRRLAGSSKRFREG